MKITIAVLAVLLVFASVQAMPASRSLQKNEISCETERIVELAKCKCFVKNQEGQIDEELKGFCEEEFGDISGLEASDCGDYETNGEVDTEAVYADVAETNKVCEPMFTKVLGSTNRQQIQTTERHVTIIICIVIVRF